MRTPKSGWQPISDATTEQRLENLDKFQYIANIIGDDYLHSELNDMVNEMKEWEQENEQHRYEED
jgi:hypothetical protein